MNRTAQSLIVALFILLPFSPAMAQGKVADILARAEKALTGQSATELSFVSTPYNARGIAESKVQGKLIQQGERFRLEYGSVIATYAQGTLYVYDAQEETLTLSSPSSDELIQINPLYFVQSRAKGFNSKLTGQSSASSSVTFTPQSKASIKEVTVLFSAKTNLPEEVNLRGQDGSRVSIKTSNLRGISARKGTDFVLDAKQYPNAELIDLR